MYRHLCIYLYIDLMSAVPRASQSPTAASLNALLRRFVAPIAPPGAVDYWLSRINPRWSRLRPRARVVERRQESADAVTLVLRPPVAWKGFEPGQHVNVGVELDGSRHTRSYSLTDIPRRDGLIAITVKSVEGGTVSRHLCHDLRVGQVLDLGAAFGDLRIPATDAPTLLMAAGSGITPMISLLRAQAAVGMPSPMTLLYWARHRDSLCFVDELRAMAARYPQFSLGLVLTGDTPEHADEFAGRLDATLLPSLLPNELPQHVLACGPFGFVETAREATAGFALSFAAEAFSPPPMPADTDTETEHGTVDITLARSGRTVTVPRGKLLLDALEAIGIRPASGCRIGICNTCACGKQSGTTRSLHAPEPEHEPTIALKLCVNRALNDLVLDL